MMPPDASIGARRPSGGASGEGAAWPDWASDARLSGHAGVRPEVLWLDDHAAGALAEQIGGRGADALLAGGRVDRGPVDHVGAHALRFLDERGAGIACADEVRVDLDARAARLDARTLEHRAPLRLLLLEALLERELAGHGQHEDRVDDSV